LLSELTINQIDQLLVNGKIAFARFADDYHIFARSREEAYQHLVYLSEKLLINQGLSLQKSKTRIMSAAEFRATSPLKKDAEPAQGEGDDVPAQTSDASRLLRFSLKFDPYSPTKEEDYKQLQAEIRKFDVIGMLRSELGKSRIHTALARKIVTLIKYLDDQVRDQAVQSILKNSDLLYPIFSSVLLMLAQLYDGLSAETRAAISAELRKLIQDESHIMRVDVHLSFAIRVLAHDRSADNQALLEQLYDRRTSPLIRRDIILVLTNWSEWYWLSDLRNRFRELSGPERRAFIVASYKLKDEGDYWRDHIRDELSPFERLVLKWAGEKANRQDWSVPI
jgi:hypothetical protein